MIGLTEIVLDCNRTGSVDIFSVCDRRGLGEIVLDCKEKFSQKTTEQDGGNFHVMLMGKARETVMEYKWR